MLPSKKPLDLRRDYWMPNGRMWEMRRVWRQKARKEKEETEKETEDDKAQTLEYGQHGFGWKGFRIMSRRAHLFRHL